MLSFSISQTHFQTHFPSYKVSHTVHLRERKRILSTSFILNIIVKMFINLCISIFAYFIVSKYYYFVDYTWFDNSFENVFFVEQSIYLDDIKVDIYFISLVSLLFCLLCSASLCIGTNPVPRSPAILLASRHRKYFLYHITLYHIILYHIISYFIVLCYIISYYIILYSLI